jgi:hypothetical protein
MLCAAACATYNGNYALSFDGFNDLVTAQHTYNDYSLDDFWTVEAWFYPYATQSYWQLNIAGFPGRHPNLNLCGQNNFQCPNPGAAICQLRNSSGSWITIVGNAATAAPNQWHHIAGSWNNATLYLYIDGVLDGSMNPYSNGYVDASNCLEYACDYGIQIGGNYLRSPSGIFSSQYFRGYIDEVRIWTVGRTQQEIKSTMNTPLTGREAGLLYYWRFDEGWGETSKSLASENYAMLGGGNLDAQPKFIPSSAPLSTPPAGGSEHDNTIVVHDTSAAVVGGAVVSVFVLLGGALLGFVAGRKTWDRPFPYFWGGSVDENKSLISK